MDTKGELKTQKSDGSNGKEEESESVDMGLINVHTVTSSELAEIEKSVIRTDVNKTCVAHEKVVQSFSINSSSLVTMAANVVGLPSVSVQSDISVETVGFDIGDDKSKTEKKVVIIPQNKEIDTQNAENNSPIKCQDISTNINNEEIKNETAKKKGCDTEVQMETLEDDVNGNGITKEKQNDDNVHMKSICDNVTTKNDIEPYIPESEVKNDIDKSCFVDDLTTVDKINEDNYVDFDGKPRKIRSVLEERQMMENKEKEKEKEKTTQSEKNKEKENKLAEKKCNSELRDEGKIPYDEDEFFWEDYLEETGSVAAPPIAFKHVEVSLQSGFVKGMKVEVSNKHNKETYWVASIIMSCGQLLRLRYDGYENDSSADFWCDVVSSDVHPIGWCGQNGKALQPPEAIKSKYERWDEFLIRTLEGAQSAPAYLLDGRSGSTPIDQIKEGMKLEVQHELQPSLVWIVTVLENVGGRLLLRYEGSDKANHDFWLFYLHHRMHPIGWAKQNTLTYKPPEKIKTLGENTEWSKVLQNALKEAQTLPVPTHIFKDQIKLEKHGFQKGWKVEALHPVIRSQICPASVVQILNEYYFLIEFDDLTPEAQNKKLRMCCHGKSLNIFPPQWCQWKGIRLTPPNGWKKTEFDWREYLEEHDALPAPDDVFQTEDIDHEFKRGMKLEAVNPSQPGQICAATITRFIDNLMWIHLDSAPTIVANHIVDVETHEIFPVGWCDSNSYPLKPPKKTLKRKCPKDKPTTQMLSSKGMTPDEIRSATYTQIKSGDHGTSSSWCPKIYFNHLCFSGPFLSKGRIADLSQSVGPGPVGLVLKEVLTMLINVAYKSSRVLRELQVEDGGNPNMDQTVLKAKYKGKSYRATVELCRNSDQIEEFCRQVCIKLECCPNLFSPYLVNGNCPENCSQLTKTKYTYYYGKKKKRKIGRPPGGHTNLVDGPKRPGKRRKYKKVVLLNRRKRSSVDSAENKEEDEETNSTTSSLEKKDMERDSDFKPPGRKKRKKHEKYVPLPSIIKTRGARMPKFTFERRTHRKISLADSVAETVLLEKKPKLITTFKIQPSGGIIIKDIKKEGKLLLLQSNPLHWSVQQVVDFMKTTDCAHLCRIFVDQEIDGQALLLLTLPTVQEHMELKLGPAIKLCHQIERVKLAFYDQYA